MTENVERLKLRLYCFSFFFLNLMKREKQQYVSKSINVRIYSSSEYLGQEDGVYHIHTDIFIVSLGVFMTFVDKIYSISLSLGGLPIDVSSENQSAK